MKGKKPSFFERLTGSLVTDDEDYGDDYEDDVDQSPEPVTDNQPHQSSTDNRSNINMMDSAYGQADEDIPLAIDMFQTDEEIIIKANVAGIPLDDLDVRISRDNVHVRGTHREDHMIDQGGYWHRELSWGSFARTITLPEEIEEDLAEASHEDGILIIRLPKLDKNKEKRLNILKR